MSTDRQSSRTKRELYRAVFYLIRPYTIIWDTTEKAVKKSNMPFQTCCQIQTPIQMSNLALAFKLRQCSDGGVCIKRPGVSVTFLTWHRSIRRRVLSESYNCHTVRPSDVDLIELLSRGHAVTVKTDCMSAKGAALYAKESRMGAVCHCSLSNPNHIKRI